MANFFSTDAVCGVCDKYEACEMRNIMQVYLQTVRGFDDSDCVRSLNLVQIIVAAKLSSSLEDQSERREGF